VIDWRDRLQEALIELEMPFTADAVQHSDVREAGSVLEFVTPRDFMLAMRPEDLSKGVQRISSRTFKIKVTAGDAAPAAAMSAAPANRKEDEVAQRALANPEVQRFRDVFGGEVRAVRDLKKVE
jgi:hypothetical protein